MKEVRGIIVLTAVVLAGAALALWDVFRGRFHQWRI